MRNLSRAVTFALVVGLSLVLAGCVPQQHHVVPTSPTTVAPVFKSDAAALAAAKEAYEGYLAASDAIDHGLGVDTSSLTGWATSKQILKDKASISQLRAKNEHTSGQSTFSKFSIQQVDQSRAGRVRLSAYTCVDISGTRLLDAADNDITPAGDNVVPLQLVFVNKQTKSRVLLIDGIQPWSGSDFCS